MTSEGPSVSLVPMNRLNVNRVNVSFSPREIYLVQVLGLTHIIRPYSKGEKDLKIDFKSSAGSESIHEPTIKTESKKKSSNWQIEGDLDSARIFVYLPEPMSGEIQELFMRIMTALYSNQVLYLRGSGSEADLLSLLEGIQIPAGLIFGRQWADQFGIANARVGSDVNYAERQWRLTYSLSEMLGVGTEVAGRKRQAWGHMRNLI